MLNFLYLYRSVINSWFWSLKNSMFYTLDNKIKNVLSLFLISAAPTTQPEFSANDIVIVGYKGNFWLIIAVGTMVYFIFLLILSLLVTRGVLLKNKQNISNFIDGLYLFFFCYCNWSLDYYHPNYSSLLLKKIMDLKLSGNPSESYTSLTHIFQNNPSMVVICVFLISLPIIFFIYSSLVAVDFIDKYNNPILNLRYWAIIVIIGSALQLILAIDLIDKSFFSVGVSSWLLNLHHRLWISSVFIVVILYYLTVCYKILSSYIYLKRVEFVLLKIFEKYTVNLWKKRLFALLISSLIYVFFSVYGSLLPKPFNLLVDWAEFLALFSFFLFLWELPIFGFFGAVWSGNTITRSGPVEGAPKIVKEAKPYFMGSKGRTPLERWRNAREHAQFVRKNREMQNLKSEVASLKSQVESFKNVGSNSTQKPGMVHTMAELSKNTAKFTPPAFIARAVVDQTIDDGEKFVKPVKKGVQKIVKKSADTLVGVLPEIKGHSESKMP